jgi:hypothetical protein
MAGLADAEAAGPRPISTDPLFDGLANQGGHGRSLLGGYHARATEEIIRQRDCGARHSIMIAYVMS